MPLDPEVAAYLESQRGLPPRSSMSVAQTRTALLRVRTLGGVPPPLEWVEDLAVRGGVAVRQYWPRHQPDLPLVVYFHGGRFFSGDFETHDLTCRWLAAVSSCRVAAVDYRLAPENPFPAAVEDAVAAVEWASREAERVGVAGDSAGACLAAVAALAEESAIECQLLIYPMLDPECDTPSHREFAEGYGPGSQDMLRGWREYLGDADPSASAGGASDARLSPLYATRLAGAPPAFVLTAEYDTLRDEAECYAARLSQAGVLTTMKRYPGAIHGFIQMPGILRLAREALADAGRFLRTHLVA